MTFPDIDTINTYGGGLFNYSPVEDPTTDRDAAAMNEALESVAEVTHTAARCWARVVLGASPALANVNGSDAGWGNASPSPPTPAHSGTGVYTVTWPAVVTDGLGATHNLNLRWARASLEGSTFGFAQASATSANVVTVNCGNSAGAANDLSGVVLLVEAG